MKVDQLESADLKVNRDKTLDYLRGLAVFQVVFVHVFYYLFVLNIGSLTVLKSFALFEMPLFFFVTGAVNSLKDNGPYGKFVVKRFKGLLVPYYVYAAICLAITAVYCLLKNMLSVSLAITVFLKWLFPLRGQIMPHVYFTWALWFIPVYLMITVMLPAVKFLVRKLGRLSVLIFVLVFINVEVLLGILRTIPNEGSTLYSNILFIIQESFFYMIFVGLGLMYRQLKQRKSIDLILAAAILTAAVIGIVICHFVFGNTLDMQTNKFPPNHVFMFYSFAVLSLLYLVLPFLKKIYKLLISIIPVLDKLIVTFSENSIYVFLYQGFAFWIVNRLLVFLDMHNSLLEAAVAFGTIYPMVWLTVVIINRIRSFRKTDLKKQNVST